MRLTIDCGDASGALDHFWRSTGFTPAKLLLHDDMRLAMDYYGSVPNGGLRHVRIHNLLDLVRLADADSGTRYDWSKLDAALDRLVENGMAPVFELMGNPSGAFSDFTDPDDLAAWRDLVAALGDHLAGRYGRATVESWYFESWNEPDGGFDWEQFAYDHGAFCDYYDACSAGLADAEPDFTLGGPGTASAGYSDLLDVFLDHCDDGQNTLTGEPVRLDFVSTHVKGTSSNVEDVPVSTDWIAPREREIVEEIAAEHPDLADLPFQNNECDPQTGWADVHTWRGRPFCAAVIADVVRSHQVDLVETTDVDYALLSNDNGFLGGWGQRTHLVRFGDGCGDVDGNGVAERPTLDEVEYVKKPAHNVMTMLSLLGDRRLETTVSAEGADGSTADSRDGSVGALASARDDDQVAVLLTNVTADQASRGTTAVDLAFEDVPFDEAAVVHYRIDEAHSNPFRTWTEMGAPARPTPAQLRRLRRDHELERVADPRTVSTADGVSFELELPRPSVGLTHLHAKPADPPETPEGLRARTYRGRSPGRDVMLSWRDCDTRAIRTYEVLRADDRDGSYERVDRPDSLATAHYHAPAALSPDGWYAVRAVDYWSRASDRSAPVRVE